MIVNLEKKIKQPFARDCGWLFFFLLKPQFWYSGLCTFIVKNSCYLGKFVARKKCMLMNFDNIILEAHSKIVFSFSNFLNKSMQLTLMS